MTVPSFLIKNGSTEFVNKQKNLFDFLESAEKKANIVENSSSALVEIDERKSNKRKRRETKQFRGKESLFKEPVDLPIRFKKSYKIPDFQRNPHKWVKYSLADITQDDMSNESNTAAALSFLKNVKKQKKLSSIKMETDTFNELEEQTPKLHTFTAPIVHEQKTSKEIKEEVNKPVFKSTKLIMPEYVVGQSKKKSRPLRKKTIEKIKEVYLNHIHEYDDE